MSALLDPARWVHPEWGPALAGGWLLLALALALAAWRGRARLRRLVGRPQVAGRSLRTDAFLLAALALAALALAGPRAGTRTVRVPASGVDVVVLVDVSRSMDARDVPPSRLDRARAAAADLLAGLEPGDRAALAAFAGRGVLVTPLTHDHAALAALLPALDTDWIRPAASRLGEGVRAALGAFEADSQRPRVVALLSDGEDPEEAGDLGLSEALRAGVRVVAVAIGTEAGGVVPRPDGPLLDRYGDVVRTRLRTDRLARLAGATDGALLATDRLGAVDTAAWRRAVRRDAAAAADGRWVTRRVSAVQVAPFAAGALALLLLPAALAGRSVARRRGVRGGARRGGFRVGARRRAALVPLALLALAAGEPPDARTLLHAGLARAESGHWQEAERAFRAAALRTRDPAEAALAYYDAGVAALRAERLEAARDAFFEALALDPGDEAARFNLEWTLRALEAEPPQDPPGDAPSRGPSRPSAAQGGGPAAEDATPEEGETAEPERSAEADLATRGAAPGAEAGPGDAREAGPPPLDAETAERWLARTGDDPARALRNLVEEPQRGRGAPAW